MACYAGYQSRRRPMGLGLGSASDAQEDEPHQTSLSSSSSSKRRRRRRRRISSSSSSSRKEQDSRDGSIAAAAAADVVVVVQVATNSTSPQRRKREFFFLFFAIPLRHVSFFLSFISLRHASIHFLLIFKPPPVVALLSLPIVMLPFALSFLLLVLLLLTIEMRSALDLCKWPITLQADERERRGAAVLLSSIQVFRAYKQAHLQLVASS